MTSSGEARHIRRVGTLLLAVMLGSITPAFAQSYTVDPCTVTNDSSALEQCNEHKMMVDASILQGVEAGVWTITSIICTVACVWQHACEGTGPGAIAACPTAAGWITACKVADGVSMAADVAGGVATIVLEKEITGKFDTGQLTGMGISVLMDVAQLAQQAGSGTIETASGSVQKINCPMVAIMDWLQTAIRWMNMGISINQANQAAKYAEEQQVGVTQQAQSSASASVSTANAGGSDSNGGGFNRNNAPPKLLANSTPSMQQKLSPQKLSSNAATIGDFPKVSNAFQNLTNHPTDEVFKGLMDGQSPMQVAQSMVGSQMGDYNKLVSSIDENKDKLADAFKGDLKGSAKTAVAFDAAHSNSGGGDAGSAGPDLSALMANMMPKKPGAKEEGPSAVVNLGVAQKKDEIKDGLHSPDRSLFDIVGARYQSLQVKFLAGEDLPGDRQPASDVAAPPANMYLHH